MKAVDSLAVKVRPKKLSDMVGNSKSISVVEGFFSQKKVVKTWLISGQTGSGKTTLGRLIGTIINCESLKGVAPCLKCESCRMAFKGKHPDIHEINGSGEEGKVEGVRNILNILKLSPRYNFRVVIVDEAHSVGVFGDCEWEDEGDGGY